MKHIKLVLLVLASLPVLLSACSKAEKPVNAKAPASIPPTLEQTSFETGETAKSILNELQMAFPVTEESWVATYGSGPNEIWMAATAFSTPVEASSELSKMHSSLAKESNDYGKFEPRTVNYQEGYQMRDADGRFIFVFAKDRWMVGVRAVVQNLPGGIDALEWVPVAG